MKKPHLISLIPLLYAGNAYASGNVFLLYLFFAAPLFQLMGFLYFVWIEKGRRLLTVLVYLALFGLLWRWGLHTHLISPEAVGTLLLGLPIILVLGRAWYARRGQ
ncbi:hypothetical protein [Massilia sp. BJB1822]|uniref:hypothetical protein n=1 Tax=Massilia sp. BJB1822 TaxID=2744470 RepID=UPI00159317C4|nr:hypothetical protein [Massilia sp. BJB1822]NVE01214.1 hypothetical protein [Massilia sp. BJB1822]